MIKCPFCAEEIQGEAIKCKHCGEFLDGSARPRAAVGIASASEVTGFKPGELSLEEEALVKRYGLNASNYTPDKTGPQDGEEFYHYQERLRKRAEHMSRSGAASEHVQAGMDKFAERLREGLRDRFDGFGYALFLFLIFSFTFGIGDAHGWFMGIFSGILMFAVLELSYHLSKRH